MRPLARLVLCLSFCGMATWASPGLAQEPHANPLYLTGAGGGTNPVRLFAEDGELIDEFFAYARGRKGGVQVASGDVDGDSVPDIVTGAGEGDLPRVRVFSGASHDQVLDFSAYHPSFRGGVFVAAGDVNGDGAADVVTGAGAGGGPHVKVFDGRTGQVLHSFFAYAPTFQGGVRVAAGDVNGDGFADIVTGAGPGGGPHVKVFDGRTLEALDSFFAYDPAFAGGVYVAAGDVNGDGFDDIVTGAGQGGGPHVKVFDGTEVEVVLKSFFAYGPNFQGGVRVAAGDVNGDRFADIVTGAGPGGGPHVKSFDGLTLAELDSFFAYDPRFSGGVYVATVSH